MQKGLQGVHFHRLFSLVRDRKIPFQMVPAERLNKITRQNHQGVIAFLPVTEYHSLEEVVSEVVDSGETALIVLLDGITDVRNLGAVARSAECAGAHALVLPVKGSAGVTADSVKASAGALLRIPVCRVPNMLQAIAFLKECGIRVVISESRGRHPIYKEDLTKPLAVVLGSEDRGVSRAVKQMADSIIFIPMKGKTGSLNVSVAAGVTLFEALRQRLA